MSDWNDALGVMKSVNPSEVEMLGLDPDVFGDEISYGSVPLKQPTLAPDPGVLAVLSAASYPTFEQTSTVERNHAPDPTPSKPQEVSALEKHTQLDENPTIAHSSSMRPARRIRSQNTKSSEEAGNPHSKRREHSPMPTESESPSERRRGQIRRAQRAYRLRQEATVLALKNRVAQLENSVEKMSEIFNSLSDDLKRSGVLEVCPDLELKLREATKKHMILTRQINESDENKIERAKNVVSDNTTTRLNGPVHDLTERPKSAYKRNRTSDSNSSTSNVDGTSNMTLAAKPISLNEGVSTTHSDPTCNQQDPGLPEIWQRQPPLAYSMNLYHSVLPPNGSNRKRFSERLKYACAKRGYYALIDPSFTSSRLFRSFGFVLTMTSRDQLAAYFKMFLESCGAPEVMEFCNIPEISLGGAGTHYPRRMYTEQQNSLIRTATRQNIIVVDNTSLSEDYRGEWFDIEDVEGFLEECGVLIDQQNSVRNSAKGSSSISSGIMRGGLPERALYSGSSHDLSLKRPRETALAVDERELISFLATTSFIICLGSTAGFRREDIETFVRQCGRPLQD